MTAAGAVLQRPPAAREELVGDAGRLYGHQFPRVELTQPYEVTVGAEAAELMAGSGVKLFPWERWVLDHWLGLVPDPDDPNSRLIWAHPTAVLIVPRQNGKGAVIEARVLAGLALLREELIVYTAHETKTARKMFERVVRLIKDNPDLAGRIAKNGIHSGNGDWSVKMESGQLLQFVARSKSSGRGFTGDVVVFDECMILWSSTMEALGFTMAAVENPQVILCGSAELPEQCSEVQKDAREQADRSDTGLCYHEWSVDPERWARGEVDHLDELEWARSNPSYGWLLRRRTVLKEWNTPGVTVEGFGRERLGLRSAVKSETVIRLDVWNDLADEESTPMDPLVAAVDISPDRKVAALGMAGWNRDGLAHLEVVKEADGVAWLFDELAADGKTVVKAGAVRQLVERHQVRDWVIDVAGPAGSVVPLLEAMGLEPVKVRVSEAAAAAGALYDAAEAGQVAHLGQKVLDGAVGSAGRRNLGDAWAWARRGNTPIVSLVAVTLAHWGLLKRPKKKRTGRVY